MDTEIKAVGFDLDGVILDHTLNKIRVAKKLGFNISKLQTPGDIILKFIPKSIYQKLKFHIYDDPQFALSVKLMPGVKSLLGRFKRSGIPFFLISRRLTTKIPIELLKKHKLWPDLFNEENTFFVAERADKNIRAIELGITHFVDDEFKVLDCLSSVGNKFLFDLHNIHRRSLYYRVRSWKELSRYF